MFTHGGLKRLHRDLGHAIERVCLARAPESGLAVSAYAGGNGPGARAACGAGGLTAPRPTTNAKALCMCGLCWLLILVYVMWTTASVLAEYST